MLQFSIRWKESAIQELTSIPKAFASRIFDEITKLADNPKPHGSRKLSGANNLYRIKINDYRVLYSIYEDQLIIQIVRIAHRKEAYRNL